MNWKISPGSINGVIQISASKSLTQRALAAALLRKGVTVLHGIGNSEDEIAVLGILQNLGATITKLRNGSFQIVSNFPDESRGIKEIHCGESGLALRMFTPVATLSGQEIHVLGKGSLLKRPLLFSDVLFNSLNVSFEAENNQLPIVIRGPLRPNDIEIDGSSSSQFLTGLLFAFSAAGAEDVAIRVNQLVSKPYVDLTLTILEEFGMAVPENRDYELFYFPRERDKKDFRKTLEYTIEGDWSNAAFLLVAGAIAGKITVRGLNVFSKQADKKILEALMDCGCSLSIQPTEISVQSSILNSFYFDATECPDLFPPLVALAANCTGMSVIKGASRLHYKESNRAESLKSEFGRLGLDIRIEDDQMIIEGGKLKGGVVSSHHDHRIAMACAIAALQAEAPVLIEHAEVVNKSYPLFFEDLSIVMKP